MTTKLQNLSKGYGYVDESNVIHKIDPKFLSNSIKLEIPADKVASLLEKLEADGIGAEVLTSVILDGETKTINASVCETIKTFAEANAIVFNFKDADGVGAAFAQCAYEIKEALGAEFMAYFACDEMAYKLAFTLDETANTLTVGIFEKVSEGAEEAVVITFTSADWNAFADSYFTEGRNITKLIIDDVETTLTPAIFAKLVNKAKKGLLDVATLSGYSKPLEIDDPCIKFDFSLAPITRRILIHCALSMEGGGFVAHNNFDCGEALPFGLSEEDLAYFDNLDYIGEKEITTLFEGFLTGGETEITVGVMDLLYYAIVNNALDFTLNPDKAGHGTVTQYQYTLDDGTFIDATIEFPSINRAVDLIFDWDDMDSITVKMRKLSQSESSDYVFYAAKKDASGLAKYYKSYNDAISGGTEVTPDWAAIRTDILKNNANAKIKLLITEQSSGGEPRTVVRTYECVGVRTASGSLEFRCIEFEGDNGVT